MQVLFLTSTSSSSAKERAAQKASARSHAATVSHSRAGRGWTRSKSTCLHDVFDNACLICAKRRRRPSKLQHTDTVSNIDNKRKNTVHAPVVPYHGNSDPFGSLPVPLDAVANLYLSFGSECVGALVRSIDPPDLQMIPGRAQLAVGFSLDHAGRQALPLFEREPGSKITYIESDGLFGGQLQLSKLESTPAPWLAAHIYSMLAYCANALYAVSHNPTHQSRAIEYMLRCLAQLQTHLPFSEHDPRLNIEELVYRLLRAELLARNTASATTHTRYLKQLFEQKARIGTVNPESLLMILHADNNLALQMVSKPVFEPDWLQERFCASWAAADKLLPKDISYDIEYRAPNHKTQELLVRLNRLFQQSSILRLQGTRADSNCWHWFVSQREWLQNCLLHEYLADVEMEGVSPTTDDYHPTSTLSFTDVLLNKCLILTTILAVRMRKQIVAVGNVALYNLVLMVVKRPNDLLDVLEQATKDWFSLNTDALLWISFILALAEAKYGLNTVLPISCIQRLHHYIALAGLRDWSALQAVLRKFPYTEQELALPYHGWLDNAFVRPLDEDAHDVKYEHAYDVKSEHAYDAEYKYAHNAEHGM